MGFSWEFLGLVAVVVTVLVAGAGTTADDASLMTPDPWKHNRGDITKCKDYVCRATCGETPYTHGVCVDGSNSYPITIECCCCTGDHVNNRYFIGG